MPLRASIVVVLLIVGMLALGSSAGAIPVAIGALFVAVADVGEEVGYRWRTMLWTTSWLMAATLIAQLVSVNRVALLLTTAVVAFACGLAGALGPRAALAALLSLVVFTIYAGSPELVRDTAPDVLLIGLGGIVQTAVTVLPVLVLHPGRVRRPTHDDFVLSRLPAHLRRDDAFLRHGARLAVAVTAATALAAIIDFPHSYWIPMSVAWMARPDRDGTATRVAAQLLGTVGGVLAVTAALEGLGRSDSVIVLAVGLGSFVALAFIWANYAVAVVGVTTFVIALFALNGGPVGETVLLRLADTLVAAVITVAAAFLWPARPAASG